MSQLQQDVALQVARYLQEFPAEAPGLAHLQRQLAGSADCLVRSNMQGHVVTSAVVVKPETLDILVIHHRHLNAWLPPGGHYEAPGVLWDSAAREVGEETGVAQLALHDWCAQRGLPLDIDTHVIPASSAKGEAEHLHHDFRFLSWAPANCELTPQLEEVHGARWASFAEFVGTQDPRLMRLAVKLAAVLNVG